jgi:uncharacterized tellurite resistance protein B-like protein
MLESLKKLLFDPGEDAVPAGKHGNDALHHAAAGLLVEAAVMDGSFDDDERKHIETLLSERFELPSDQAAELIESAEEAAAERVELHTITKTVRNHFDEAERIHMIEMLWEVVYADGKLDDFEANMMRRVAGLLYVSDRDSGAARKRVLAGTAEDS